MAVIIGLNDQVARCHIRAVDIGHHGGVNVAIGHRNRQSKRRTHGANSCRQRDRVNAGVDDAVVTCFDGDCIISLDRAGADPRLHRVIQIILNARPRRGRCRTGQATADRRREGADIGVDPGIFHPRRNSHATIGVHHCAAGDFSKHPGRVAIADAVLGHRCTDGQAHTMRAHTNRRRRRNHCRVDRRVADRIHQDIAVIRGLNPRPGNRRPRHARNLVHSRRNGGRETDPHQTGGHRNRCTGNDRVDLGFVLRKHAHAARAAADAIGQTTVDHRFGG